LNKEKGFKKDVKNFNSYEEAVKWARENFEKFNPDMIKYKYADGGGVGKSNDKARYRIRKSNGNIKYAGTDEPSWFNLEKARELVDYSNGEMIYEYDKNGDELWEVFADGGQVYVHKSNPDITLEFIENTNKGIKGLQKNPKSLSKKERKEGIIVYYSDSEMKQLFNKKYADGGSVWEKNGFTQYPRTSPKEWELVEWSLDGHSPYFKGRMYFQANTGLMFIAKENDEIYTPKSSNKLFWRKQKKYADGGDVDEIKIGDTIHARWNKGMRWTSGIFKGETENGFEVYDFSIEKPKYIEYYAEISKDGYGGSKIYKSKKFKDRNYKNYNFSSDNDEYAKGGDIPHEDKMFQLPLEMVIYVPSTQDVDKVISVDKMDKRVDEVKEYLASKFGGYTSSDKLGGYVDSNGNLVNEDVVQITSFSTKEAFEENKKELIQQIAKWGKDWGQEAIGFEFEGDLMYVPQEL
jgi:hypothetical protein